MVLRGCYSIKQTVITAHYWGVTLPYLILKIQ
jgi:hypothetical protein